MQRSSVFARSVDLDAPIDEVYAFHLDTRNAPLISPAGATFLAIEGDFPVTVGSEVRLRVRQSPIPFAQTWLIRIPELKPSTLVVDEAVKSPFAQWRHEHRFEDLGGGRTRMTDHITYRLPFGPIGRLVDRLVARKQLEAMFAERHVRTQAHFLGSTKS